MSSPISTAHSDRHTSRWAFVLALGAGAFLLAAAWVSRTVAIEVAPRPVTPRGALSIEEQANIAVFEKLKSSVVYISTSHGVDPAW